MFYPNTDDTGHVDYEGGYFVLSIAAAAFIVNIFSDYIALFIIRGRFVSSRISPFIALMAGPFLGILFVNVCIFIRALIYWETEEFIMSIVLGGELDWLPELDDIRSVGSDENILVTSAGALLVHLWLPFFALCVGLLKGLNYFLLAANTAQWFLKRGKDHPLEAVGFVAAPLVFLLTATVQMLR